LATKNHRYDDIIIGSGSGGLAAGIALSRAGRRVLILEQHYLPGGWGQSFSLGGARFSPGVHYVGMDYLRLLASLGLTDLEFCQMNPDGFDHLLIGEERFDIPQGYGRYLSRLIERFPAERQGIVSYFETMGRIQRDLLRVDSMLSFPDALGVPFKAPTLAWWGLRTQRALLDKYIRNPLLRDILAAQSGNHGLAPSRVALAIQASMVAHYLEGGYYPLGGAKRIVAEMVKLIRRQGGKVRLKTRVTEILIKDGHACGVKLVSAEGLEEVIEAENVISNAVPHVTFNALLPKEYGKRERFQSRFMEYSVGMQGLFCTVDLDLRDMGYDSGNYWWFRRGNVGAFYERAEKQLPVGEVDGLFLAITSLKDPSHQHKRHVIEMFTFVPFGPFERWSGTKQGERGSEYEAFKGRLGDMMIRAAEHIIPGLGSHVTFRSDASPLTAEHYCASPKGNSYGTAKTPWQIGPFSYSVKSSVPHLYSVGASTLSHGMAGTAISGLQAAAMILRAPSMHGLLDRHAQPLRIHSADHPELWYDKSV